MSIYPFLIAGILAVFLVPNNFSAPAASSESESEADLSAFIRKSNLQLEARQFYEGDIKFAESQIDNDDGGPQNDGNGVGGTGLRRKSEKWRKRNGHVTVPYVIDRNALYSSLQVQNIRYAMKVIEYETGCIRFRKRTDQRDFIMFATHERGCWSYVGRVGGRQVVNLDHFCADEHGVALHEIIHALGFYHMHSHTQRDNYVQIRYENIEGSDRHNFHKIRPSEGTNYGTKYDYLSIMHYGPYYFSANGGMTIVPRNQKYTPYIGQRNKMSAGDIKRLKNMYGCESEESEEESTAEESSEEYGDGEYEEKSEEEESDEMNDEQQQEDALQTACNKAEKSKSSEAGDESESDEE